MASPVDYAFNKLFSLFLWLMVFSCCIVVRLAYLQLYLRSDYQQRAQQNFLRVEKICSRRGNIVDCYGNLLATNRPITTVYWKGTGNRQLNDEQIGYLNQISPIVHCDLLALPHLAAIKDAERFYKIIPIIQEISFEQLSRIMEQLQPNPNIHITNHLKRFYPHKQLGCHIIGYISNTLDYEPAGQMGLEKMLEPLLKGEPGQLLKTINSIGANLYQEEIKKALAGQDIVTTIDLHLQQLAEESFEQGYAGSLIIMDPRTGAVRVLVSRPSFDPELFLAPIGIDDWQALQLQRPFLNRAFNACYPPASLFKLVTLSAALENHLITPETTTYCRGFTNFRGRKYHCNNKLGHGVLTITQAVAQSCNPIFYEIGKKISIDTLAEYAHRFGLGKKTDVLFSESAGTVPSKEWKKTTKGEPWWPGETLSAVIGQSYLTVTPLQIACMIASIFHGYRVRPRVLENEVIVQEPLQLRRETRDFLKEAMKAVVDEGLAITLRKLKKNMNIYAKTGTAQVKSMNPDKEDEAREHLEHAWFAGYIQPYLHDPLVLVVLVEHAKSSKVATKIVKNFLIAYQNSISNQLLAS